jgi:predicted TIM-barrel fold metal-dependent hydrolase
MKKTLLLISLLLAPICYAAPSEKEFFTPEQDKDGLKSDASVDQKLPNVLILGDSISIAYTVPVRKGLEGSANVVRPKANCGDTRAGIANIDKWLGDTKWDVIHFNWGLHDLCYRDPKSKAQGNRDKANGVQSVSIPDYEKNLEQLVQRLEKTGAKLIWASTTFVPEGEVGRVVGDDVKYNTAAESIMKKHGIVINDLHATTAAFPPNHFTGKGNVHYTQAGSSKLAAQVIAKVNEVLGKTETTKVIDCHVHLYALDRPDGIGWIKKDDKVLYVDHLPAIHEPVAKANGVDGIVLVQAGQSIPDNQWNLDVTAHNKKLYRGVVGNLSMVIGTDEFKPLFEKLCKDSRYLGYRISGRPKNEIDDAFYRDLKLTAAAGKSVDILLGSYTLKEAAVIASKVPELRIIIDHFGGVQLDGNPLTPEYIADFHAVSKAPNVYCKVSALYGRVKEQPAPKELSFYKPVLDLAFECFGEDRLVYGSDWPVTKTTGNYASVLALTRSYFEPKGAEVCEKLFHRNAEKFYAIPPVK